MMNENLVSRVGTWLWRRRRPQWVTPPQGQAFPQLELTARALPRYALDRTAVNVRRRIHGTSGKPWITADAIEVLDGLLRPGGHGLEFGSGGSTEWLAQRLDALSSVEAFDHWYDALSARLIGAGIDNVNLELVSADRLGYRSAAHRDAYVNVHPDLTPGSLDLVFVDGEYRDHCALRAISLLRPGGVLVLDNADTYLPSSSRSPWKVPEPVTEQWKQFSDAVQSWPVIWTTNGVWDTAVWLKPVD